MLNGLSEKQRKSMNLLADIMKECINFHYNYNKSAKLIKLDIISEFKDRFLGKLGKIKDVLVEVTNNNNNLIEKILKNAQTIAKNKNNKKEFSVDVYKSIMEVKIVPPLLPPRSSKPSDSGVSSSSGTENSETITNQKTNQNKEIDKLSKSVEEINKEILQHIQQK